MPYLERGLSPRVRGNHDRLLVQLDTYGSIPARAGEPQTSDPPARLWRVYPARAGEPIAYICQLSITKVYPRACGGTWRRSTAPMPAAGLSPRVRGNRDWYRIPDEAVGSIPARAGEPLTGTPRATGSKVYPRACGGTSWRLIVSIAFHSPRERDSPYLTKYTPSASTISLGSSPRL